MLTRNERQLKAVEQEMERFSKAAQAIWAKADEEDRETSPEEKAEVEKQIKAIETLKQQKADLEEAVEVERKVKEVSQGIQDDTKDDPENGGKSAEPRVKDLGAQFVESEGFKRLQVGGSTSGSFTTGKIALKTTLFEGDLDTPGAGKPLVPDDRRPGILPILFERLTIANLMASGSTNSNVIRYVVETVADAGSIGTVEEGALKPEAELSFDEVDEPVRKIASFLPVSDEMLEDAAQIRSYINARLTLFVQMEEENQLLNGDGTGTNLDGLLNRVPVTNQAIVSDVDAANDADHIYAALTEVRTGSYLEPDAIVVNPADWADIRLLKDGNNNYLGGSPFSNTGSEPNEALWGKRVVVTAAMEEGTAMVGAFGTAAQVYRRGGLTVEASNSHNDYFRRNLTAIRAEERLALAVYRPEAFATADLSGS